MTERSLKPILKGKIARSIRCRFWTADVHDRLSSNAGEAVGKKFGGSAISSCISINDEYDSMKGPSLLKKTLGLQRRHHSKHIGPASEYEPCLMSLNVDCYHDGLAFRRVSEGEIFLTLTDEDTYNQDEDIHDLDAIEDNVAPHGKALISLYFRIVHPSFPILHKKVYLEKYSRSHREFSPPLLAAVYILALSFWGYSSDLSQLPKPNVSVLERIALRSLGNVIYRPKLSTIQAGLLLLQRSHGSMWALTAQLVAVAQELGLHLDCTSWSIPKWEIGLRKRLAWAMYMQDAWASVIHGRPSHIAASNWAVQRLDESDFPENADDENEEEGSTEVEKGRLLFSGLVLLTKILADILETMYSHSSTANVHLDEYDPTRRVLELAKPLQLRLRSWYANLPKILDIDNVKPRKLSSTGYLHLAYFSVEFILHRPILRTMSRRTDPYLVQICRDAAKARLNGAMQFVNRLRSEHLQSFWYFASENNFKLLGVFQGLLWSTAASKEEAEHYHSTFRDYCWLLRISNKNADFLQPTTLFLDRMLRRLETSSLDHPAEIKTSSGSESEQPFLLGSQELDFEWSRVEETVDDLAQFCDHQDICLSDELSVRYSFNDALNP
ncbi:MAG: hypothetical protein LQ351_004693 [Letrouitia transgressa]|nr:MAG: hypothetical protein LQ351_004693 [Letrouitia transgressa]